MKQRTLWIFMILLVAVLASYARLSAVELLPIDYDEDDYLSAGQYYAEALRRKDWQAVIDYDFNYEHPPLSKLAYGFVFLGLPEAPRIAEPRDPNIPPASSLPRPQFEQSRRLSAFFGILEALALAVIHPVAGLFVAMNSWHIKYTSQVMLEPLPALTSALSVVFYVAAKRRGVRLLNPWMLGSAVMLGLTAAAKYMYCIVGLAILVDWWLEQRSSGHQTETSMVLRWAWVVFSWGLLAMAVFFAFNPHLWNDPIVRLRESIFYHGGYAVSEHVARAGFPFWQPLVWLTMPVPWSRAAFVLPTIELLIFTFAIFGLQRLWERQRVFALWFGLGFFFLVAWPTKWPQYILMLSAPLGLAAAHGFDLILVEPVKRFIQRRSRPAALQKNELPPVTWRQNLVAAPWLLIGMTILLLITLFPLFYQAAMALTDLNVMSLKDGINGGVWRAVWQGLSGRAEPIDVDFFSLNRSTQVRYTGPNLILAMFNGATGSLVAFEILWTGLSIGLQLVIGLILAMILDRPGLRFKRFWRLVFILPWAVPEFVGALMWLQIYDPQFGWAAQAARAGTQVGGGLLAGLIGWRENSTVMLILMLITATWYGFPIMMLAATAGLKFISTDIYDAAAIDGASGWHLFRLVTWPLLLPILAPVLIIRAIFAFNQFYLFYVFSPQNELITLSFVSFYFVREGTYAVSAAINIFIIVVLIVMILLFNRWSKASEGVTYA